MLQEAIKFKQNFLNKLDKYEIPFHNRSIYFYTLANKIDENPTSEELKELLLTAICDAEFLLYHFLPEQTEEEIIESYRATRLRINTFHKVYKEEKDLDELWKFISKRKTLPNIDHLLLEMEATINNEVNKLCHLYYKYFEIPERQAVELRNNLEHFVSLSYSHKEYHSVAPFFFYQIMVKHTKRIASKENFQFSPKNLWEYKKYKIVRNNNKNYDTYEKNARLFIELFAGVVALCEVSKSSITLTPSSPCVLSTSVCVA